MSIKTRNIIGFIIILAGLVIIGLELSEILNNESEDLGMIVSGVLNVMCGFLILGSSKN